MKFKIAKIFPFFHKKSAPKTDGEVRKEIVVEIMPESEDPETVPKTPPARSVSTTCSVSIPPTNIEEAINRVDQKIEKIDNDLNDDTLSERNRKLRSSQKQILQKAKNDLEMVQVVEKMTDSQKAAEKAEKAKNSNFIRRSLRRVSKRFRKQKPKQQPQQEQEKEQEEEEITEQDIDRELDNCENDTLETIGKANNVIESAGKITKSLESQQSKILKDSRKI